VTERWRRWGRPPESLSLKPQAVESFASLKPSVENIQFRAWVNAVRKRSSVTGPGTVQGIAAPYGSLSVDLGGFREEYQRGCFAEFLKSGEDALVLAFHNPEHVLGRMSNGTARFWEEDDGLHYEAELPDTQIARDLSVLLGRGDVSESSSGFYVLQHRWEQRSSGRVRIIEKAKLVEASIVCFPCYADARAELQQEQIAAAAALLMKKSTGSVN
jgi:uncharacterized protein